MCTFFATYLSEIPEGENKSRFDPLCEKDYYCCPLLEIVIEVLMLKIMTKFIFFRNSKYCRP